MLLIWLLPLCLFILLLAYSTIKPRNFPPGPIWLPVLGSLPFVKKLSKNLGGHHLAYQELAKRFKTDVLGLKLGNNIVVVVSSYPLSKEILTNGECDARPRNFFIKLRCFGQISGITCADGLLWKNQKGLLSRHLSSLGFGKGLMEHKIREELQEVLEIIEAGGEKLYIGRVLSDAVVNILWSIIAGKRISRDDPRFGKMWDLLTRRSKAFDMSGGLLASHPWLRYIAPEMTGYNLITSINKEVKDFFMDIINEHLETWTEGKDDDLIYAFISEMRKPNSDKAIFTVHQLLVICLDFFLAGTRTTSDTTDFAFLTMLLHPDIQIKVQSVLDEYNKIHKNLNYVDRQHVPYVEAVLAEAERYCGVAPLIGPRRLLQDTKLAGYDLPKNATIMVNAHALHKDKKVWNDPEVFKPERFLDSEGKFVSSNLLLSFGLGKKRCLGEVLARNFVFTFFTEIIQRYAIKPLEGLPLPSSKPLPGLTASPEVYFAQFVPRKMFVN